MSKLLEQLHQDHINVSILLDLIDEQLSIFELGELPDFKRLYDIMSYMTEYPDIVHHPREDLVFSRMMERDRASRPIIEGLMEEHQRLTQLGNTALEALRDRQADSSSPPDKIAQSLSIYCKLLREHMNKEEAKVFPLAKLVLTAGELAEIDAAQATAADPLFGEQVEHSYRSLFEFITQQRRQRGSC